MGYQLYSRASSGWRISNNPDALPARQWRIEHDQWGMHYFPTHD
jgi:hypothetical protein